MYCTPFPFINPSSATYLFIVFFRSLPRAHGNRWSSFLSVTSPCPKMFILGLVCYLCRMIKVCRLAQRSYKGQSTCGPATHCWTWLWPAWHCNPQLPKLASKPTFFFFKTRFLQQDVQMLWSWESWSIMRPKSKKKNKKNQQLADVLYACSWSLQSNIIIYFKLDSRPWWIWSKIFLPGLFWFDLHVSMKKLHFVSLSFSNRLKY